LEKTNVKYRNGCEEFVEFTFYHLAINNKISCPCRDCKNKKNSWEGQQHVRFTKGWNQDYVHLERWHCWNLFRWRRSWRSNSFRAL